DDSDQAPMDLLTFLLLWINGSLRRSRNRHMGNLLHRLRCLLRSRERPESRLQDIKYLADLLHRIISLNRLRLHHGFNHRLRNAHDVGNHALGHLGLHLHILPIGFRVSNQGLLRTLGHHRHEFLHPITVPLALNHLHEHGGDGVGLVRLSREHLHKHLHLLVGTRLFFFVLPLSFTLTPLIFLSAAVLFFLPALTLVALLSLCPVSGFLLLLAIPLLLLLHHLHLHLHLILHHGHHKRHGVLTGFLLFRNQFLYLRCGRKRRGRGRGRIAGRLIVFLILLVIFKVFIAGIFRT